MSKKINELQAFFIQNNPKMSDVEISRITGLSSRQVSYYRKKGKNREGEIKGTPESIKIEVGREEKLTTESQKAAANQPEGLLPIEGRPAPSMRIDALLAKKKGVVSMTHAASELSDMFDGVSPESTGPVVKHDPFADPNRVHRIKP